MVIDVNKPIEVVANWDETIVYPATLLEVLDNGAGFRISIDAEHEYFKDGRRWPAGDTWRWRKDGTFAPYADLTLRNVQEVDEITWENCPEWAKDEAAKRIGFDSWSDAWGRGGLCFSKKTDAPFQLAVMIAKYEKPADPSIEIAREIVKRYYPEVKPTEDDPRVKIAVDAYRLAIKDQKASRDAERSEPMKELLVACASILSSTCGPLVSSVVSYLLFEAGRDAERSKAMEELLAGDSELLFEEGE